MSVRVSALFRYPVKGFPAEPLDSGTVRAGTGFDGDRAAAFSSGRLPVPADSWSPYRGFAVLKTDMSLEAWQVSSTAAEAPAGSASGGDPGMVGGSPGAPARAITLRAPDGERTGFRTDDADSLAAASTFLAARLRPQGEHPRRLVVAGQGMFDSRASGVSLINPATVEMLGEAAGVDLDPLRFRGNVHLSGLAPWEEFGLIGRVVRVGSARLLIRASIERCPATRVNPRTAEDDVNVPRLLAGVFGHVHLGVYGIVLEPGTVGVGDALLIEGGSCAEHGPGTEEHHHDAGAPAALDPRVKSPLTTPRPATVLDSAEIDPGRVRVRLRDELGWFAALHRPGMHARVHLLTEAGPLWRTYTVTAATGSTFELGVGVDGVGSRTLTALPPGAQVLVSGPFGRVTADTLRAPRTLVLTAGIGITPALGLLPGLGDRSVDVLHVERGRTPSGFFRALVDAAGALPAARVRRWSTQERGRPDADALGAVLTEMLGRDQDACADAVRTGPGEPAAPSSADRAGAAVDVVLCGPPGFLAAAAEAAHRVGVPAAHVHREIFSSPAPIDAGGTVDLTAWEPATVRTLTADGSTGPEVVWTPAAGFLLDALEARGFDVASSCRGGSCGTCALRLVSGQVAYPVEPAAAFDDDEVITCSAVPVGDVELTLDE